MKALFFITFLALSNQINCLEKNEACVACKKWSNFVWNLTNNADEALYSSLSKLCVDYADSSKPYSFCNKSLHTLFGYLNQRFDKDKFCYDIDACDDSSDDGIRSLDSFVNDDADCKFCIYINTKIKELISGSPTEIEIKHHFEDACHYLKSFESECLNLVDEYIDTIFKFIKEKYIPEDCCKSLRICQKKTVPLDDTFQYPSSSEIVNILPVNMSLAENSQVNNIKADPTCEICKKIVKIIQRQLQDNATDQQIVNVLSEVCELFPSNKRGNCQKVVRDYAKQLIQILSQDIDSDTACLLAGLCVNQSFNDYLFGHYLNKYKLKGNALCIECEMICHFIQNEIYNYKNEEQVENWIKNHLCNKMAYVMTPANCQAFIDQYGPIIMQTIAQDIFNPDMLCFKELKLCKKTKIHVIPKDPKSKEHVKCEMCQNIIKNISSIENSDFEIEKIIKQACQQLPSAHQVDCALMVRSFAPYFLDMLDRYENPKKICEAIDICLTPGKVHLLGGHKCTYGPSYWCHSVAHANACQAYKYCHENKLWTPVDV